MRPPKTRTRTCLLAIGLTLIPLAGWAQTGVEDQGVFNILVNGRQVGTEEFSIRQSGVGENSEFIATGRVQVLLPSGSLDLTSRLRSSGFQANPVAYEVTVGGDAARRIVGTVGSGRFSAKIMTPSGEQLREYVASSGATVVDEGIAHHYYFVARRTRSGSLPIIIPRENRQTMAAVEDRGEEQMTIGGTATTLYHLVMRPQGGEDRHVWVDVLGRVIRVEIPDRSYVAVRAEVPR
ncbi:MAG TPA: hypothetical protein VMN39_07500 [Longimicrobiaceae bacterium]|nr:hypothetical protein [Longimicrobiaceae bacterium]